jgi:hypothetical protein
MNRFKEILSGIISAVPRIGFWFLLIFMLGMAAGGYGNYKLNEWQMQRSIQLKGLVFDNLIYDLRVRP